MSTAIYLLLGVSLLSLTIYLGAFVRLVTQPHHQGIVRTAICRVVAACLYLMIAMAAVAGHPSQTIVSLSIFVVIQVMWQANAMADVLLTRRENRARALAVRWAFDYRIHPKHRKPRRKT